MKAKKALAVLLAFVMTFSTIPAFSVAASAESSHVHTDDCYAQAGDLLCTTQESEGHTHGTECYCAGGELACGFTESEGHTHDDSCYDTEGNIICGLEERESHNHSAECYCGGGELICMLEETEGHAHGEDCYAAGGELICGFSETGDSENNFGNGIAPISEDSIVVTTAEDLRDAVKNAADGDVIVLGADITYDVNAEGYGVLTITKNITLDCGGCTLRSADGTPGANDDFINITRSGKLTLLNAQIETGKFGSSGYLGDFVTENRGSLIVKSTGAAGIKAYYLAEYNYGTVEVDGGTLDVEYVVEYSYGNSSVAVSNAAITCGTDFLDGIEGTTVTVSNSTITIEGEFIDDEEYSTITVTDCVVSCDDLCEDMTGGRLTVNGGTYTCESDICNCAENAVITLNGGTYECDYVIDEAGNCDITVEAGSFTADGYAFDDLENCTVMFKKGSVISEDACFYVDSSGTSTITIYDGTFESTCNHVISNYAATGVTPSTVNIYSGTFVSHEDDVLDNEGVMNIYGGTFEAKNDESSGYYVLTNEGTATLSGGTFQTGDGTEAIYLEDADAVCNIAAGYKAIPADWETAKSDKVEIVPIIVTITYISEGVTYKEISAAVSQQALPENPTHSGGYDFLYWETEQGERVDSVSEIYEDSTLYAVFSDRTYTVTFIDKGVTTTKSVQIGTPLGKVESLDRTDSGDGFLGWKLNGTIVDGDTADGVYTDLTLTAVYAGMVMNYDELTEAINNKQNIILGADIVMEDTAVIDYDCVLDGNTFGLIRPEGFAGALLSTKRGVTGGEETGGVTTTDTTLMARNLLIDGKNLDAYSSAVYVSEDTTLIMENVTVQNNKTNLTDRASSQNEFYVNGEGGAMHVEENAVVSLTGCSIQNNSANSGGGIYATSGWSDYNDKNITLTLKNCTVTGNAAVDPYDSDGGGLRVEGNGTVTITGCEIRKNTSVRYGGGLSFERLSSRDENRGGATITDTIIAENEATYGGAMDFSYSNVDLYGTTSIEHNKAERGGACDSGNGGNSDDTILTMHDNSSMSYNEASDVGGALYAWEQTLVMNDNSSLHHNNAGGDGGAVYMRGNAIIQNSGVICDNHADGKGGGVYNGESDSAFNGGMIYDNTADEAGDDLFSSICWSTLYRTQSERKLGDGNSETLGTVQVETIDGYYEPDLTDISVPYYGWFIDGSKVMGKVYKEVNVYKNGRWTREWQWVDTPTWPENTRYQDVLSSVIVSAENENLDFLGGEYGLTDVGGKAIWYGVLLAYDANYPDSTAYKYDSNAYLPSSEVKVQESMFTREGYRFIGWNTQADGNGTAYAVNDEIVMDKSQVLYAQWERVYSVKYEVTPDQTYGTPSDVTVPVDAREYLYGDEVTVEPDLITSWTTSDGTETGVPGTWTFTSWDKESGFLITDDTIIKGSWSFTPSGGNKDNGVTPNPSDPSYPGDSTNPVDPSNSNVPNQPTGSISSEPLEDKTPQTGDEENIGLWISLIIPLGVIFGVCIYRRKRRNIGHQE